MLILLAGMISGLVAGSIYLHFATYRYAASLSMVEAKNETPLPSGMMRIASLAGIGLKEDSSKLDQYLASIRSQDVAKRLATDQKLMHRVFDDQWDDAKRVWQDPAKNLRAFIDFAKAILGVPITPWAPPGPAEMQRFIDKSVDSFTDIKTNITTVTVVNPDPAFASALLARLHAEADNQVRHRTIAKSGQYVEYIARRLPTVTLSEHRVALAQVLSEQEAQMMMASAVGSYAVDPLGAIAVSPRPVSPKPVAVLLATMTLGLFAGMGVAFLRDRRRRHAGER